jgi:hypothetical protein
MPDEKSNNPEASEKLDLRASLADAWEVVGVLEEKVTDLDLQVSSALIALEATLPGFAEEFERAYNAALAEKRKLDSGFPLRVQRAIRQLRKASS